MPPHGRSLAPGGTFSPFLLPFIMRGCRRSRLDSGRPPLIPTVTSRACREFLPPLSCTSISLLSFFFLLLLFFFSQSPDCLWARFTLSLRGPMMLSRTGFIFLCRILRLLLGLHLRSASFPQRWLHAPGRFFCSSCLSLLLYAVFDPFFCCMSLNFLSFTLRNFPASPVKNVKSGLRYGPQLLIFFL